MVNKKVSDGVGKKIVEALKKQSEIEITPIPANDNQDELKLDELTQNFESAFSDNQEDVSNADFLGEFSSTNEINEVTETYENIAAEEPEMQAFNPSLNHQGGNAQETFMKDLDTFEIPSNIAVLKKLIAQLPSGVSRHTGAQIIKQTMEALGISMKSVLQEAQQVQDGLNNSVTECYASIQDYKKQILTLEKQAQNYQRQYMALNELISLFIQTGV
jgi:hypothetical protein